MAEADHRDGHECGDGDEEDAGDQQREEQGSVDRPPVRRGRRRMPGRQKVKQNRSDDDQD
ncbi:hypothetical protein D3C78_1638910 [compost metagenome]